VSALGGLQELWHQIRLAEMLRVICSTTRCSMSFVTAVKLEIGRQFRDSPESASDFFNTAVTMAFF